MSLSLSASLRVAGARMQFNNVLVVIKQTAFEEYSQLKLRGQAPKALRWKRLEQRFKAHKQCVTNLIDFLRRHNVNFSCVNRVELDRQHLADVDLLVAVGGDGTLLSTAHFLDHGTIPLLGINSDPNVRVEDRVVKKKQSDERRSHGALCMCTSLDMEQGLEQVLYGATGLLQSRTRIRCKVKSTYAETSLVPALNDLLLANPSPAAVSRFRLGWLKLVQQPPLHHQQLQHQQQQYELATTAATATKSTYGTISRFGGKPYDVVDSINVWSSGMWICTGTGSTAAMAAAGGQRMSVKSDELQYLIREHMMEAAPQTVNNNNNNNNGDNHHPDKTVVMEHDINNGLVKNSEKMHVRWNSQYGRIFIDGSHLSHNLELGDEIMIDNKAPPLMLYYR